MDVKTSTHVLEVRQRFLSEYEENKDLYEQLDAEMVEKNDWSIERFLIDNDNNVDKALEYLKVAMKWRKKKRINHLKTEDFPREFWTAGLFHEYVKDRNGYMIFYSLWLTKYQRIPEWDRVVRNFSLYMVELMDKKLREDDQFKQLKIVHYCKGGGFKNIDLLLFAFMTKSIIHYYPCIFRKAFLVGIPTMYMWVIKLAMSWVPQKYRDIIELVDEEQLADEIGIDNLPNYLNGSCQVDFHVEPPPEALGIYDFVEKYDMKKEDADKILKCYGKYAEPTN